MTSANRTVTVLAGVALATLSALIVPAAQAASAAPSGSPRTSSEVANLHAVISPTGVALNWTVRQQEVVHGVAVRLARGAVAPASPSSGAAVRPSTGSSAPLGRLANGTYTAGIWTRDASGRWSAGGSARFQVGGDGVVHGVITEKTGAALAGAVVSAENYGTGDVYLAHPTGADGQYRLSAPAGEYDIVVDASHATGGNSDSTGYVAQDEFVQLESRLGKRRDFSLAAGGEFTGTVTDRAGHPLDGVQVSAGLVPPYLDPSQPDDSGILLSFGIEEQSVLATTDAAGMFALRGVGAGAKLICFDPTAYAVTGGQSAIGYSRQCTAVGQFVHAHHRSDIGVTQLSAAAGGALTGTVRNAAGHPIAGVYVSAGNAEGTGGGDTQTAADGTYHLSGLPPGGYIVCADPQSGAGDDEPTGSAPSCKKAVVIKTGHTQTADFELAVGGAISGTVLAGGQPVHNAYVDAFSRSGGSGLDDVDGHYLITGLAAGRYRVCFGSFAIGGDAPTGYRPQCRSARVIVTAGEVTSGINGSLTVGAAVAGTVTDSLGRPVRYPFVEDEGRYGGGAGVSGDANGHFLLGGLRAGSLKICAEVFVLGSESRVTCTSGVTVRLGRVTRNVNLKVAAGGSVNVTVRDNQGHPVAAADAALVRPCSGGDCDTLPVFGGDVSIGASWTTDPRGHINFVGVPTGHYSLCVLTLHASSGHTTPRTGYADRCGARTYPIAVTAHHTSQAAMTVTPGGEVTGTVIDQAGQPLAGVVVHVPGSPLDDVSQDGAYCCDSGMGSPQDQSTTAGDGTFTIAAIRAGTGRVCLDASEAVGGSSRGGYFDTCLAQNVTVSAGAITAIPTITLQSGGAISGVIRSSTGAVIHDDGFPDVFDARGRPVGDGSGTANGGYVVDRIPAGTYYVCFEGFEYRSQCYKNISWPDGQRPPLSRATPITVAAGALVNKIDAALVKR